MKITAILITLLASTLTYGETTNSQPWETAAVQGLEFMNQGNGDRFAEVSHTNFKSTMRYAIISVMKEKSNEPDTKKTLQTYGVDSISELESIPLDKFVSKTIIFMHQSVPPEMQSSVRNAKYKILNSKADGTSYLVTIEGCMMINGTTMTPKFTIRTTKDKGVWKYNGEA